MSLFDDMVREQQLGLPRHIAVAVRKVFGTDCDVRPDGGEFTEPLTEENLHLIWGPEQVDAERERITAEWRKSRRKGKAARTRARNKRLRSAGIDPDDWARLCRNNWGAPPEIMDEIVAAYLAESTNEWTNERGHKTNNRKEFSKECHYDWLAHREPTEQAVGVKWPHYLKPAQPRDPRQGAKGEA